MIPKVTATTRPNGVAVLTICNPPVNALSTQVQGSISATLKNLFAQPSVRAVVIQAIGSPGFFSGGADVSEFSSFGTNPNLFNKENTWCYDGIQDASIPVVIAIDGHCLGGALELAMCCTARVSTYKSTFSLPELKLGIIPGLGGTQRLPRLVGFEPAVKMMLTSDFIPATHAKNARLVDVLVKHGVTEAAVEYATKLISGKVRTPEKCIDRNDRIGTYDQCKQIADNLLQEMVPKLSKRGRLPHFRACVEVCLYGVQHGGRQGLLEERRVFGRLVTSPESLGTIHMFFATRKVGKPRIKGDPNPKKLGKLPKSVGIVGGGLMGAGIAASALLANIPVVIKELNDKFAQDAKKRVERNLGKRGKSKLSLLKVSSNFSDLANVDIVIEAALEKPSLKQEIFSCLEKVCRPDCILATNTSTINLDLIALGAPNAQKEGRIIGVHFFSPAHKMPLLEVVRTDCTSAQVIKDVLAFGKKIKKTSVLVGNCAGFGVNRLYFPQSMVAAFLLIDLGLDPYHIDRVFEDFGLPMGPFRLIDLVGLDIGVGTSTVFGAAFAERTVRTNPAMASMLAAGRKGQKSGAGFYRYSKSTRGGIQDSAVISSFLDQARKNVQADRGSIGDLEELKSVITDEDIVKMVFLACVNEGYRIVDEGIVQESDDLDVCSVLGMAFPAHRGGLMYWAQKEFRNSAGVMNELDRYYNLSRGFPLFKPSFALVRSAAQNRAVGQIVRPALVPGLHDDIVVVSAFRTAVGRGYRGGFKDTLPDDLIAPVLKKILEDTGIKREDVGDIVAGKTLQRGDTSVAQLRIAGFLAGLPESVPVKIVNRLCSSGLQAIADGAAAIKSGYHDIIIAGGVENMSITSFMNKELVGNPQARHVRNAARSYLSMGETSENVAASFGVSRESQDRLAVCSHARALAANLSGKLKGEIVSIATKVKIIDRKTKKVTGEKDVVVNSDEGVRMGVTLESLAKLNPVFRKGGSTTAGNSSQISDGAALVMLMKRSEAESRGLTALASLRSFAVVGVDPGIMGIGPAVAIPKALEQAGIGIEDVDLFEINEAFASQADYCIEKLGLNRDIVNVNGGAIAIGHPLGMTGARLSVSIIHEMRRRGGRFGVVSMCVGTGMGAAAVYEINRESAPAKL